MEEKRSRQFYSVQCTSLSEIRSTRFCCEWYVSLQCGALCCSRSYTPLNQWPRPRAEFRNSTPLYSSRSKHAYSRHRFIAMFIITWDTCVRVHFKVYCELVHSQSFKNRALCRECREGIHFCRRSGGLTVKFCWWLEELILLLLER